jgi:hypothetical protein
MEQPMISYEEFVAFADSVDKIMPGFAANTRKYKATTERFLPNIAVKMKDRAEKFRGMGLVVPARFFAAAPPAEKPPEAYTHEELLSIFRPAWEMYQRAGGASASG